MKKKTMFAYLRNAVLVVALYVVLSLLMSAGVIDRYYSGIFDHDVYQYHHGGKLKSNHGIPGTIGAGPCGIHVGRRVFRSNFTTTVDLPAAVSFRWRC